MKEKMKKNKNTLKRKSKYTIKRSRLRKYPNLELSEREYIKDCNGKGRQPA